MSEPLPGQVLRTSSFTRRNRIDSLIGREETWHASHRVPMITRRVKLQRRTEKKMDCSGLRLDIRVFLAEIIR